MQTPLSAPEFRRYGRQMQVPEFQALTGQEKLKASSILVVGAGGLGSSALLYLSAAGVGHIGIQDFDIVEETNLHRQVIHDTTTVGMLKCDSAKKRIEAINPFVKVTTHPEPINNLTGPEIVSQYDLILDCTDRPSTRYIISDLAVLCHKPLVSGSAIKTDGQLSILNYPVDNGPCYRCFYPTPPKPETVGSCADAGVIGSCVGLVGVMMCTEAIKLLTGYYDKEWTNPFLGMYSGYGPQQTLRNFKMRGKRSDCECQSMTLDKLRSMQYDEWCGSVNYQVLPEDKRMSVDEFEKAIELADVVLDVRPREQFNIANVDFQGKCKNIPWKEMQKMDPKDLPDWQKVLVVCRRGNASQLATQWLLSNNVNVLADLVGGLSKWSEERGDMPIYW
ncbi:Uba4 protein [Martiniozyma asiatica (nom. inval.)]|nr:Uba4 protein [Martiniozyma asiatica]